MIQRVLEKRRATSEEIVEGADLDGDIHALAEDVAGIDPQLHLDPEARMAAAEFGQPRREGARREDRHRADAQNLARRMAGRDRGIRRLDRFDRREARPVEGLALGRQRDGPVRAPEEQDSEPVLDPGDELAHRRGRQREVPGGRRKAAILRRTDEDEHLGIPVHRLTYDFSSRMV